MSKTLLQNTGLGLLLACAILPVACSKGAARQERDIATEGLPADVRAAYEAAKDSVRAGDYSTARTQLSHAVKLKPDFTEGWYNLGSTTARLAAEAAALNRDAVAIALFRQSVAEKRKAQALILEGKWCIYGPDEQAQVTSDLDNALENADEVMANERSLLIALKMMAR